ncbi:hypothetical protein KEM60_01922 [Austwickia sp. TVS 96-490-7B]|nr:hypothetical protein [Austwickia sp. TVS 96-490-7B]
MTVLPTVGADAKGVSPHSDVGPSCHSRHLVAHESVIVESSEGIWLLGGHPVGY